MRELLAYHEAMTYGDYTSDDGEEQLVQRRKKKGLKSGMHRPGTTTVVRKGHLAS